ncbi:MAG: hypothetical protein KIT84_19775 [Labilithrix sp.]|nr:hypothetical protein [Labilithrix sp.]MCW5813277.1 hypothetical protein [Labilithrix sp.]
MPRLLALVAVALAAGCAAPRTAEGVTPIIHVSPGVAGRLALMDRYRLHDEERKLMMQRPRVWVEEVEEEEEEEPVGVNDADAAR